MESNQSDQARPPNAQHLSKNGRDAADLVVAPVAPRDRLAVRSTEIAPTRVQPNDEIRTSSRNSDRRGSMIQDQHNRVIAIDGPAAAGKTTVARSLANRVGAIFLDTGLLYRAVTFEALRRGIEPSDGPRLAKLTHNLKIAIRPATIDDGRPLDVLVDGEDVTSCLRSADIDRHVSEVSAHQAVRDELLPIQRQIASGAAVVMVGRDIGSVVTPNAGVKIFLDASVRERARRRHDELIGSGRDVALDTVLSDLERRDKADSNREAAPLMIADGSHIVETDGLTVNQVVDEIERIVRRAWAENETTEHVE